MSDISKVTFSLTDVASTCFIDTIENVFLVPGSGGGKLR